MAGEDYTSPINGKTYRVPKYEEPADAPVAFKDFADNLPPGGIDFDPDRVGQVVQSLDGAAWDKGMALQVVDAVPDDTDGEVGDVVFIPGGPGGSPEPVGPAPGLVHVHTESFSGESLVSIGNVFSSAYDNYRLVVIHAGGNEDLNFRLQSSGTPSTTNYSDQTVAGDGAVATAGRVDRGSINLGVNRNPGISAFDIHAPFLAQETALVGTGGNAMNGSHIRIITGIHSLTSSYDGFTLTPGGAQGISGTVHIYGYSEGGN